MYERKIKTIKDSNGKYIPEHRYIMEQHLGRKLKNTELVHHINGNSLDNEIENLLLCDHSEHQKYHLSDRLITNMYKNNGKYKHECKNCDKIFMGRKDQQYCSGKCRNKFWINNHPRLNVLIINLFLQINN